MNYIMDQEGDEEGEGEDLLDKAYQNYLRIEALGTYGTEGMDNRQYRSMGYNDCAAVEQVIAQR